MLLLGVGGQGVESKLCPRDSKEALLLLVLFLRLREFVVQFSLVWLDLLLKTVCLDILSFKAFMQAGMPGGGAWSRLLDGGQLEEESRVQRLPVLLPPPGTPPQGGTTQGHRVTLYQGVQRLLATTHLVGSAVFIVHIQVLYLAI